MRKFALGFAAGLIAAASGATLAAKVVGSSGYLSGWTVTVDGDEVCSDPYVHESTKEIECDD